MDANDRRTPAIVLGEGITALTAVQDLGRNAVPVYLVGSNRNDIAYHSRYATPIDLVDATDARQVVRCLKETAESLGQKPVLLCTSDFFLEMISTHRDEIEQHCVLNLPSREAVATVIDKGLFGEFCARHDLLAPRSWKLTSANCLEECKAEARFPVAIKPLVSHKAENENFQDRGRYATMIMARNPAELVRVHSELSAHGANLVVQEYIDGPDSEHYSYVSYRDSTSKEVVGVGIRKIRVFPVHAGVGTFAEVTGSADLAARANKVLDALHYKGISSVCFKRDATSGQLVLHELNGRLPQLHSASRLGGVNLSYVAYQHACGAMPEIQVHPCERKKYMILRLDCLAFLQYRRLGEMSTTSWLRSLMQVRQCTELARDDLRPFWFLLKSAISRIRMRVSGKIRPPRATPGEPAGSDPGRPMGQESESRLR